MNRFDLSSHCTTCGLAVVVIKVQARRWGIRGGEQHSKVNCELFRPAFESINRPAIIFQNCRSAYADAVQRLSLMSDPNCEMSMHLLI
jgi:hypothetical protein